MEQSLRSIQHLLINLADEFQRLAERTEDYKSNLNYLSCEIEDMKKADQAFKQDMINTLSKYLN